MKEVNKMETFGERIQIARGKLCESQSVFGRRFGVTPTAVSLWESGKREAPYQILYFIEDVLKNWKVCEKCKGVGWIKSNKD